MKIYKNAVSGIPIPPGVTLREELAERGITQSAFARQIKLPVQMFSEIINGRRIITSDIAIALEKALGISAEMWLRMEMSYQISKARAALRKTPSRRARAAS